MGGKRLIFNKLIFNKTVQHRVGGGRDVPEEGTYKHLRLIPVE